MRQHKRKQFGHFHNIIYKPDWLLSAHINDLIDKGIVKYYPSLKHFKNRINATKESL